VFTSPSARHGCPKGPTDGCTRQPEERNGALAAEVSEDSGRPLDLATSLRFLPLVAAQQPVQYDAWALRWLARWIEETPDATVEGAAEVSALLADSLADPSAIGALKTQRA
jgi:hypothetical protein